jgi:hypothetical protein
MRQSYQHLDPNSRTFGKDLIKILLNNHRGTLPLRGQIWGRLRFTGRFGYKKRDRPGYTPQFVITCETVCECGTVGFHDLSFLQYGQCVSCNCIKARFTKEEATIRHRLQSLHWNMLGRCEDKTNHSYKFYGARGIRVCREWRQFDGFYEWALSVGYEPYLTIERKNLDGHYEPSNCTFIPAAEQAKNKRTNRWVSAWGETKILSDWCLDSRCVVGYETVLYRIRHGMTPEEALTTTSNTKPKPNARLITAWGETKWLAAWSRDKRCKVTLDGLQRRLKKGLSPEVAMSTKSNTGNRFKLS